MKNLRKCEILLPKIGMADNWQITAWEPSETGGKPRQPSPSTWRHGFIKATFPYLILRHCYQAMQKVFENNVFGILIAGRNDYIFLTDAVHKTTLVDNTIQQNLDLVFRDGRDDAKTTYQRFRFVQQILVACRRRRFTRVFVTYILGKGTSIDEETAPRCVPESELERLHRCSSGA